MPDMYAGARRWRDQQFSDYGRLSDIGNGMTDFYRQRAMAFDPSGAMNRYAKGAWGSISQALGEQLRQLSGSAVGAGRFDSGFYDQDQGVLVNRATDQFANAMAGQAMNAAEMEQRNFENVGSYGERARESAYGMAGDQRQIEEDAFREEMARRRRSRGGIGSAIGAALGAGAGTFFGNPMIGAQIGSGLGGYIGGR